MNLLGAQDFYWEEINSVPEGYQYVMDSNDNREMVVAGMEFSDDYSIRFITEILIVNGIRFQVTA